MNMSTVHLINLIFAAAGSVLGILGLIQTLVCRYLDKETRIFFISFFGILEGYVLFIMTREIIHGFTGAKWVTLSRIAFFGQALLSSVLAVLITGFMLYQSGVKDITKNHAFRISFTLWLLYAAFLVSNLFHGRIYSVDENNAYSRGPLYPLLMVSPVLIMMLNLWVLWQKRHKLTENQKRAFAIYVIAPMVAMLVQMWSLGVHLIVISTVTAAIVMFSYIIADQTERYYLREVENHRLKVDILLAQIQPHFLFNSLTTIKLLCRKDPAKAEDAVTDFTAYLRRHMESLQSDVPIPFEEEIKHVQAYLNLQKLRFGDELNVVYDLEVTDFRIPTLTLQPLVENAVTYGVRRSESGCGTVTIRSRSFPDRVEVCVEDDGPGFVRETLPNDRERSHIGLQNVREHLIQQCGGKLLIDSTPGKGTKVTIILTLKTETRTTKGMV